MIQRASGVNKGLIQCVQCGSKVRCDESYTIGNPLGTVTWGLCTRCDGHGWMIQGNAEFQEWWDAEGMTELAQDARERREVEEGE